MTKTNFRIFRFTFALAIIFTIAYPNSLNAQTQETLDNILGKWGLGKKKKDFNKEPDRNEFQLPTNGEYKANPTFFAARSDNERCNAVDLWLSSIRYEASQSPSYSRRIKRGTTELDMENINAREIQKFATPAFRNLFGKGLSELSEKELNQIGKSLDKCSYQKWVTKTLEYQFTYPVQLQDWIAKFDDIEKSAKNKKVEAQQRLHRERYQKEAREKGYNVAELLKETDLYSLHAAFLSDGYTDWCSPVERQAVVGLIFNIDEKSPIENDAKYWQSFESEMLPVIRSSCSNAEKIYILNYAHGFYINYNRNQVESMVNPSYPSDVINIAVYSANQSGTGQRGWINGDSMSNLIGSTSRRTQRAVTFRNSENQLSNANLVTISSLRNFLAARKAKLDEEARIRAEKAAAAETARRAEIARKVEDRRIRLAIGGFSSKGLKNEELFANIFLGDFEALPFQRDDMSFSTLFGAYLKSFAEYCPIPKTSPRVEMTRQVCERERITTNGWGVETSRTCIEWRTEGTGLFADPALYAAKSTADRAQAAKILNPKSGGGILGGIAEALMDFTSGKTLNEMGKAIDVSTDVAPLVSMNACSGPGLKRFQENLRRFALNERPLLDPLPSARKEISPVKTESEKPQTVVQKTKPATKKPSVKSRRKN